MRRIVLLLSALPLIASCSYADLIAAGGCDADFSNPKRVSLKYEPDGFGVPYDTEVSKKSLFVLNLRPSRKFRGETVKVEGNWGQLPGQPQDPSLADWLNTSDTYNNRRSFVLCVPDVPKGTVFKYTIYIGDYFKIDPRLEVTR